jgi:hypothetical protein
MEPNDLTAALRLESMPLSTGGFSTFLRQPMAGELAFWVERESMADDGLVELAEGRPGQQQLAQLWALYFQLRSIKDPPAFLASAEETLRRHLNSPGQRMSSERGHLRRVQ